MSGPILTATGLIKRFGSLAAVDGIGLDIMPGEMLGVIGPNGSGKSTLFKLLCGELKADGGEIRLHGKKITSDPTWRISRRGLVMCHQIPSPFRELSCKENLLLAAHYGAGISRPKAGEKAAELLEFTGLAAKSLCPAGSLNLAQRRRLELARALASGPDVILLDENLAGLTPGEIEGALELLKKINQSGVALVMVEHIMQAVTGVCERLVVLDFGKMIAEGAPGEVMSRPEVIKAYLGDSYA